MGELQGLVYHGLEKTNPIGYKALKSEDENQKIPVSYNNRSHVLVILRRELRLSKV